MTADSLLFNIAARPADCSSTSEDWYKARLLVRMIGADVILFRAEYPRTPTSAPPESIASGTIRAVAEGAVELAPFPDENGEVPRCPCCDDDSDVVMLIPLSAFNSALYLGED